jgi:hypothetical protein
MFSGRCCQNKSDWEKFISELKDGDRVAVQIFHPHKTGAFDTSMQYWELYEGEYRKDTNGRESVWMQSDRHCVVEGIARYGYEKDSREFGDVFPYRIVRWSEEFTPMVPKEHRRYYGQDHYRSPRPVYEPLWDTQSFLIDKYGPNHGKLSSVFRHNPQIRFHCRDVYEGTLYQVFYDTEVDHETIVSMPEYLYSEDCWN